MKKLFSDPLGIGLSLGAILQFVGVFISVTVATVAFAAGVFVPVLLTLR